MKNKNVFLLLWIIAFFAFIKGYNAGWCYDAITFSYTINEKPLSYLFNLNADYIIRFVYFTIEYVAYYLFGEQGWDWYILKITIHSINAFLLFIIAKMLLQKLKIKNTYLSLCISILFLISPYTTEVVLYQATLQYALVTLFIQLCIFCLFRYIETDKIKYIYLYITINTISIFTSEITFVFPLIIFVIIFIYADLNEIKIRHLTFPLISLIILIIYLSITFLLLGKIVGHYGPEIHLEPNISRSLPNFLKFFLDIIAFTQYWNFDKMYNTYVFIESYYVVFYLILFVAFLLLYYFVKDKKRLLKKTLVLLLCVISLLPVINLFFLYVTPIEGDRYYYFSLIFVYLFVLLITYNIDKVFAQTLFCFLFVLNFILLQKNVIEWQKAQKIIDNSLQTFNLEKNKKYMFLAVADRIGGALIFASDESKENPFGLSDFAMAICIRKDMQVKGKIGQVLNYNVTSETICPIIEIVNDTTLKYTLPCCGQWWWKRRHGATDFENDYYRVKVIGGWQQEVLVTLKQKPKDMIYIYQCGEEFVELKF